MSARHVPKSLAQAELWIRIMASLARLSLPKKVLFFVVAQEQ
jgi:hypothetical protein